MQDSKVTPTPQNLVANLEKIKGVLQTAKTP